MDEQVWLAAVDPTAMLTAIRARVTDRKGRLFGCACCRRVWHIYDSVERNVVEVAERLADGTATNSERRAAAVAATQRQRYGPALSVAVEAFFAGERGAECAANEHARTLVGPSPTYALGVAAVEQYQRELSRVSALERAANVPMLRDIFGNPFRPVSFSPDWRTDTAVVLAKRMYESREFSAMPILADALQDAGCDSDDVLTHCRDANATHVRGCWVVDLVLGKE
jgi:hypothetical protein